MTAQRRLAAQSGAVPHTSEGQPRPPPAYATVLSLDQVVPGATTAAPPAQPAVAATAPAAGGRYAPMPGQRPYDVARRDSLVDMDDVLSLARSSVLDMDDLLDLAETVPKWEPRQRHRRHSRKGSDGRKSQQGEQLAEEEDHNIVFARGIGPWGGGDPRQQAPMHAHYLSYYRHSGAQMRYKWVYLACPPLWLFVGDTYKYIDVIAGVMFVLGSLGFWLLPFWFYYQIWSYEANVILYIIAVALFLLAKVFLELRALYAIMWKRANRRQSFHYHHGLFWLIVGGILSLINSSLALSPNAERYTKANGYLAFASNACFFLGTWIFAWDGYRLIKPGLFSNVENQYFWGSAILAVGGVLFLITGFCSTGAAVHYSADYEDNMRYKEDTFCGDKFIRYTNGVGGFLFEVGSVSFLIYAIYERKYMENGPDPRQVAYHGYEEAHPAHYEPHHLHD